MRQLIVNADDFGYTRGVNRAIVDAHRTGIVTSTSLMANGAAFEDAASLALSHGTLDVGCHLNLVEGLPVAPPHEIPHLVDVRGRLHPAPRLGALLILRLVPLSELERECAAQVEKLLQAGLAPSHLDTHQHAHLHPTVATAVARTAKRYGISWVRRLGENCTPPLREGAWRRRAVAAGSLLFVNALQRRFNAHGLRTPDSFTGFVLTGRLTRQGFLATLAALPEGLTELMCHPGYCDSDLQHAPTSLKAMRQVEQEIVSDACWRSWLKEHGVSLTNFRALTAPMAGAEAAACEGVVKA